jgi:hypothetical protein
MHLQALLDVAGAAGGGVEWTIILADDVVDKTVNDPVHHLPPRAIYQLR